MTPPSQSARAGHLIRLLERRVGKIARRAWADLREDRIEVRKKDLLEVIAFFKEDPDTDLSLLVDITAVDHLSASATGEKPGPTERERRFEVIYTLRSPRLGYRLWLSVRLPEEHPTLPTATRLYPTATWLERELSELFGIYIDGHPHLRPLLLYSGFIGHPLRRGYPATKDQPLLPLREPRRRPILIRAEEGKTEGGQ